MPGRAPRVSACCHPSGCWRRWSFWGTFSPAAPYGDYTQTSLAELPTSFPGLLFDQQFGLVPNAPVYLVAFAGLAVMVARRRRLGVELALVALSYLMAGVFHICPKWMGGAATTGTWGAGSR
jgi:hypothetical protein